ncbi:hypothetical protein ANANG_G00282810 [Anguilla anguilla]|uniref:WAS/WASL interacting protein family member 2 n=1 Tax=Anguilla anguilla TaxID=7936 RepID=A0A9D3RJ03_ANGAN|nr:hypothetical protein ANANG_G00282810 [Anguilla anguilla]
MKRRGEGPCYQTSAKALSLERFLWSMTEAHLSWRRIHLAGPCCLLGRLALLVRVTAAACGLCPQIFLLASGPPSQTSPERPALDPPLQSPDKSRQPRLRPAFAPFPGETPATHTWPGQCPPSAGQATPLPTSSALLCGRRGSLSSPSSLAPPPYCQPITVSSNHSSPVSEAAPKLPQRHNSLPKKTGPGCHTPTRGHAPPPPPARDPPSRGAAPPPPVMRTPPPPPVRNGHIFRCFVDDFESKYSFHPLEDFPAPEEYRHFTKIYPSKTNRVMRGAPPLPPVGR